MALVTGIMREELGDQTATKYEKMSLESQAIADRIAQRFNLTREQVVSGAGK